MIVEKFVIYFFPRRLRKASILLAGTNKDTQLKKQEELEAEESVNKPIETPTKKKSIKNLFGLLSFGNGKKSDKSSAGSTENSPDKPLAPGERERTSTATNLSTENGSLNESAKPGVSFVVDDQTRESHAESSITNNSQEDSQNGTTSGSNQKKPLKLRSKSMHRVVSVRLHSNSVVNPAENAALTPSSSSSQQHFEESSSPLASPYATIFLATTPSYW